MNQAKPGRTALDEVLYLLEVARADEAAAKKERLRLEEIACGMCETPEEGTSKTITKWYTCTTTGKLTRKLHVSIWDSVKHSIPQHLWPIRVKVDLDMKKLRALATSNPAAYAKLMEAKAIESKPAKTGIKVEARYETNQDK